MTWFIVAYDLVGDDGYYSNQIRKALKLWNAKHIQLSVWEMPWPSTSEALVNHLRQFVGPRDRILVVEKSNPAS